MNMTDMKNEQETSVFLTDGQAKQTLGGFYRSVAQLAGHEETDDTMYDCCKILVSGNVQEAIIQAYQDEIPGVRMESIISLLAIGGPKMNAELGQNEVRIQLGFIRTKTAD